MSKMTDGVTFTITLSPDEAEEARRYADDMEITVEQYLSDQAVGYLPEAGWGDPSSDPTGVASLEIADAIASLERARAALEHPSGLGLDLSDFCATITRMITKLQAEDVQLTEAAMVVMEDAPIAISLGVRPWEPPLSPHGLLRAATLAQRGAPVTITYRQALQDAQTQQEAEAHNSTACPVDRCGGTKVNRPGGTRTSACWGHLPDDEKADVQRERAEALTRPCPSCSAGVGERCSSMGRGSSIHPVRLNPHLSD